MDEEDHMHNDDSMIGRLLTRRELVALFGSSAVAAMAHRVSGQAVAPQSGTAVPACVVQPQQTEGPYFVDEKSRRSDIRSDLSTGAVKAGAPLALAMKVSQVTPDGKCAPLADAQVDLWQCDAMGAYSDVKDRLFDTTGQKFLRGHQITDATGAVKFVTIYPGWYPGRAVHVHFKVRTSAASSQAYEFTSQFYFDEQFTDRVHAREPYVAHTGQRMRNENDGIFKDGGSQLMLPVTEVAGSLVAAFDLAMRPGDPPPAGRGGQRGGRRGGR
jgi:protocatechuate 3,4-dioxygenase beta subunit